MKKTLFGITFLSLFAVAAHSFAQPGAPGKKPYIVVFKNNTPFHQFSAMASTADARTKADPQGWGKLDLGVLGAVQRLERGHQLKAKKAYSHTIKGFATDLTDDQRTTLQSDPNVDYIEEDGIVRAYDYQPTPWGVAKTIGMHYEGHDGNWLNFARITNAEHLKANVRALQYPRTLATSFFTKEGISYGYGGRKTTVYVVDSGMAAHHDYVRVTGRSFMDTTTDDCRGHGTHVAGTIGALHNSAGVVGTAPGVSMVPVKVLDCAGRGNLSAIINAVDWITKNGKLPGIVNMSLGGPYSKALNDAVQISASRGFVYVLAAGNDDTNACDDSPASASTTSDRRTPIKNIITVGALDKNDRKAGFSNWGPCVSIWAPGVDINSTSLNGGFALKSGTSMAAPHVAGIAALMTSRSASIFSVDVKQQLRNYAKYVGFASQGDTKSGVNNIGDHMHRAYFVVK